MITESDSPLIIDNDGRILSGRPRPPIRRDFWSILGVTVIVVGLIGIFAQAAFAEEGGWRARVHAAGFGHHGMGYGGPMDAAAIEDRVERMVAHLAIEIDATDEQKQKLTGIFVGAANDLLALHEEAGDRGEAAREVIDLLTGPTVDRIAIEKFRADKMALADRASKRIADALIDAAEVLTPEQRETIGDRLGFFAKFGQRFHRG